MDFIKTIFEDKKRNVGVPTVRSMRAERKAKRVKLREEGEDALETADDLVGCTGEQSAGGETTSKDASSLTDPRTYSLGGTCYCYSLFVTVFALCEGNAVSFCFQSSRNKQQNSLCIIYNIVVYGMYVYIHTT